MNPPPISYRELTHNGLWKNNPALVQLLGLCPLLGVSNSVVNALGLGLATIVVLVCSNTIISLLRHQIPTTIRLPAYIIVIASLTTCVELLMRAYTYELYQILGIFIPIIVTNCAILGRADSFASRNSVIPSFWDGLVMGAGFLWVLVLLGAMREMFGSGTLFAQMSLIFGEVVNDWHLRILPTDIVTLAIILPPGAFICAGLLIALKNEIDYRIALHKQSTAPIHSGHKRVRVTGHI